MSHQASTPTAPNPNPSIVDVTFSLLLNVVASCGTIFINKHVFKAYKFGFGTTLTVCHFVVTFVLCFLCSKANVFEFKRLPLLRVLPISLAFCGYVVFNNISLLYNSVSFYQVMKILCTPVIILIERYVYSKSTDTRTLASLVPVCLGIFITVVTDFEMNLVGTLFALVAVVANSLYTIYGKTKQNELQANAMQILLYQSAMSAVILLFAVPFFDDVSALRNYEFNSQNIVSCVCDECVCDV